MADRDFNSTDDVVAFLDDVMIALTTVDRGKEKEPVTIQSQLKATKKMDDFYGTSEELPKPLPVWIKLYVGQEGRDEAADFSHADWF